MANVNADNEEFKQDMIALAVQYLTLTTSELDPYTRKKGQIETNGLEVSLYTPDHIQFARYGRGPGKRPPLDPILKWVGEKGIVRTGQTKEQTAYAIMNYIGKNGTVNWVKDAPNALDEALRKNFLQYNKALNGELVILFDKQTSKIYKEIPFEKNFKY